MQAQPFHFKVFNYPCKQGYREGVVRGRMGLPVVQKLTLDRLAPVTHGDVSCHMAQCDER